VKRSRPRSPISASCPSRSSSYMRSGAAAGGEVFPLSLEPAHPDHFRVARSG
jgi:hypothetical protein